MNAAHRQPLAQALALCLLLPVALTWPMAARLSTHLPVAPEYEGAAHAWGLWAALHEGALLHLQTGLLAFPEGVSLVLVDPANLPLFGLGHALAGPSGGMAALVWGGLALVGLAGALLSREAGADPRLGALAAMVSTPALCAGRDGITEDLALGWVGIQLALLLRHARTGSRASGLGAGLALAAAWYGGPYNGLLASLLDLGLAAGWLLRRDLLRLRRVVGVGLFGLLLCLPLASAVLGLRAEDLPGGAARAGLPVLDSGPERYRGGLMSSADLLDPWLPAPLTGAVPAVPHSAYLGVVTLLAAILAVVRDRRRWPWLAAALGFVALSFGPHLYLRGEALRAGGDPLLGPAGLLVVGVPAAGRITRWYRAAGAAALLLAPLAASAPRRPAAALALAAGLLLDAALLAPLPWPRPSTPLPEPEAWAMLATDPPASDPAARAGAVLELPLSTSGSPGPGEWRDAGVLAQIIHHRPLGGAMMGFPPSALARRGQRLVLGTARSGLVPEGELAALHEAGFAWIVLRLRYLDLTPTDLARLDACLGPPAYASTALRIHPLPPHSSQCREGTSTPPR